MSEAESDIIEILDYIHDELKNPTAAKKLYQKMLEAIERASLFPYAMPKLKNEVIMKEIVCFVLISIMVVSAFAATERKTH